MSSCIKKEKKKENPTREYIESIDVSSQQHNTSTKSGGICGQLFHDPITPGFLCVSEGFLFSWVGVMIFE